MRSAVEGPFRVATMKERRLGSEQDKLEWRPGYAKGGPASMLSRQSMYLLINRSKSCLTVSGMRSRWVMIASASAEAHSQVRSFC